MVTQVTNVTVPDTKTYKVVVGDRTFVKKVIVGTPLDTVVIGPYADFDNIVGVDTTGKAEGSFLVYDSASGNWVPQDNVLIDVDGRFYPSDSDHSNILIRRSGTQGQPVYLQQGELAYSFLRDNLTDGFGNGGDRLYIATGENNDSGYSTRIDVIGGKYFTDLLNHPHGVLTKNSAIIVDSDKRVNVLLADSAAVDILRVSTEGIIEKVTTETVQLPVGSLRFSLLDAVGNNMIVADSGGAVKLFYNGIQQATTDSDKFRVENDFEVFGLSFLDSTFVDGDLTVSGNLTVLGETTNISSTQLVIEDKQIVIGDNTPYNSPELANGAGFALGDSALAIAYMRYENDPTNPVSRDSAYWYVYPGIRTPKLDVPVLEFELIDCGFYA